VKVGVLNLGLSNLHSIVGSLRRLGVEVETLASPVFKVDALVFPGVGNFVEGARRIQVFKDDLLDYLKSGGTFLGVCLGMQLLFERSEEGPGSGLGYYGGEVRRLKAYKLPHMGWNRLMLTKPSPLTEGVEPGEYVYFMHSFAPNPVEEGIVLAVTNYGSDFPSIIGDGGVYGTQFHPEKSGKTGEKILRNFARLVVR